MYLYVLFSYKYNDVIYRQFMSCQLQKVYIVVSSFDPLRIHYIFSTVKSVLPILLLLMSVCNILHIVLYTHKIRIPIKFFPRFFSMPDKSLDSRLFNYTIKMDSPHNILYIRWVPKSRSLFVEAILLRASVTFGRYIGSRPTSFQQKSIAIIPKEHSLNRTKKPICGKCTLSIFLEA